MISRTKKVKMTNKCTSSTGHFDDQEDTFEQCTWHCQMKEIQGFVGSHWTPPVGNYSLHIAPVAARTAINHTTMKKYRRYDTTLIALWRRSGASLEDTGCHHQASACSNNIIQTYLHQLFVVYFIVKSPKKATKQKDGPNNNRLAYQTGGKHLTSLTEYFVGGGGGLIEHLIV